jgi:hypothetical protein
MGKTGRLTGLAMVLGILLALSVMAETPEVTPKITDVTVFKDGHTLVMSKGEVKVENGWCRTRTVPVPVMGAFWAFVTDTKSEIDFLKSGFVEDKQTRPCLNFDEIVQANKGKKATIFEQGKDALLSYEGILAGILQHESEQETELSENLPAYYDQWGRYVYNQQVRETKEGKIKMSSTFIILETDAGTKLIKRESIHSIVLADKNPNTTHSETKQVREISMHLVSKGKPVDGDRTVGFVYFQKGIRWIPDYKIQLSDDGKATISLQGTIINDLADLENTDLRLVVGVPSFIMKDNISPIALREIGLRLSSYFASPRMGARGSERDYLSNAMMSQRAGPADESGMGGSGGGPEVPAEGQQEDLFLYHKQGITLKKGERAVVKLLEVTVPYKDLYTWEIPPLPAKEMWQYTDQNRQRQMMNAVNSAKSMHAIRLTNSGDIPWTTGPATIFKGGTPLGQQLMTYTSAKNTVDVPITIATDLNTKKEETEISRDQNIVINGNSYSKINLHGKLTVTNFKDKPVNISITRHVLGKVDAVTENGKITLSNIAEDASVGWESSPWYYWWSWPWWWYQVNSVSKITWDATIPEGKSITFEYDWYYYYRP